MTKALPFIHQHRWVARKAIDVSAADLRYQTQVKTYDIFSRVLLRLFSGLEILIWHRKLYDKANYSDYEVICKRSLVFNAKFSSLRPSELCIFYPIVSLVLLENTRIFPWKECAYQVMETLWRVVLMIRASSFGM